MADLNLTPAELIQIQRQLRMSNVELAKLMGRSPVSVWRWRAGHTPVPIYVDRILGTLASNPTIVSSHSA